MVSAEEEEEKEVDEPEEVVESESTRKKTKDIGAPSRRSMMLQ